MTSPKKDESSRPTTPPTSLQAPISPPRARKDTRSVAQSEQYVDSEIVKASKDVQRNPSPTLAAIEAGEAKSKITYPTSQVASQNMSNLLPPDPGFQSMGSPISTNETAISMDAILLCISTITQWRGFITILGFKSRRVAQLALRSCMGYQEILIR